jgi:hypothetical protein
MQNSGSNCSESAMLNPLCGSTSAGGGHNPSVAVCERKTPEAIAANRQLLHLPWRRGERGVTGKNGGHKPRSGLCMEFCALRKNT